MEIIEKLKSLYEIIKSNNDLMMQGLNFAANTEIGKDPTAQDIIHHLMSTPTNLVLDSLGDKFKGMRTWIPGQYGDSNDTGPIVNRLRFSNKRAGLRSLLSRQPSMIIIGTCPTTVDNSETRLMTKFDNNGPVSYILNSLDKYGVGRGLVYYTVASKFAKADKDKAVPSQLITFCKPLLHCEILALNPKVIVTLGTEPTKALLDVGLDAVRGRVEDYCGIPVIGTTNPSSFFYNTAGVEQFELDMKKACGIANGTGLTSEIDGINYPTRDYQYTSSIDTLETWVKEEITRDTKIMAIDFETGTDTARDEDSYGITFQWSSRPTHARVFCLRGPRGQHIHSSNDVVRYKQLFKDLLDRPDVKLLGHNLRYDVKFCLKTFDLDLFKNFGNYFDTMEAYHILQLDTEKGLKPLTIKYTNMGAYDYPMKKWCEDNSGTKGLKLFPASEKQRFKHGFRDIDYKYLLPYSANDVDSTYRLYLLFNKRLELEENKKLKKLFYQVCMPNHEFLNEIETNGMPACKEEMLKLANTYHEKVKELTEQIRVKTNWPEFNPASSQHKAAFLFNGSVFKDHEKICAKIPAGAIVLGTTPLFNSGTRVSAWGDIKETKRLEENPGVDRSTLKLLAQDKAYDKHPAKEALDLLKKLGEISQFAKTFLSLPVVDDNLYPSANDTDWISAANELEAFPKFNKVNFRREFTEKHKKDSETWVAAKQAAKNEGVSLRVYLTKKRDTELQVAEYLHNKEKSRLEENLAKHKKTSIVYNKGLMSCIRVDGTIATRIDPLSETGRMKHKEPNLANLPKSKEGNIEKVFGYKLPTVRSSFIAPPGYVILEADYSAAEVWTMSYLGGDMDMLKLLKAGVDIHCANAKRFFNVGLDLDDESFKKKYKYKRAAAKGVIFSIAYGTQAPGLARRLSVEMGEDFPVSEAEEAINAFYRVCYGIGNMLEDAKRSVLVKEYVETAFGRRRYFPGVSKLSREAQAAAQREGPNARIQGTVAECLNIAGINLTQFRKRTKLGNLAGYKIMNAIHDANLVLTRIDYLPFMCQLMKYCMSELITIPCSIPNAKLQIDCEAASSWGELKSIKDLIGKDFDRVTPFKDWCADNKDLLPKPEKTIVI